MLHRTPSLFHSRVLCSEEEIIPIRHVVVRSPRILSVFGRVNSRVLVVGALANREVEEVNGAMRLVVEVLWVV